MNSSVFGLQFVFIESIFKLTSSEGMMNALLQYTNTFLQNLKSERDLLNSSSSLVKEIEDNLSTIEGNLKKLLSQASVELDSKDSITTPEGLENAKKCIQKTIEKKSFGDYERRKLNDLLTGLTKYGGVKKKSKTQSSNWKRNKMIS